MRKLTAILKAFIPKDKFLFGVTTLAGSTAVSQLVIFLVSPVLTRLYNPEDFGVLGVYMSVLSMLAVLSSLRLEFAIPLPEADELAANLLGAAFITLAGVCILLGMTLWLFGNELVVIIRAPGLQPYLWLLPLGVAVAGLYNVLTFWALRYKGINPIARTKLIQGIAMVVTQTVLGFIRVGSMGLIIGYIIGNSAGTRTLYKFSREHSRRALGAISFSGMWGAVRRYRKFPLFSSFSSLLNTAGLNLPTLVVAGIYGPQVAGWFALVQKLIAAPITLIGKAVTQVYISEAPVMLRERPQQLKALFATTSFRLLLLSAIPGLMFLFAGPWLFGAFFGEEWKTAGSFAQVLALMFVAKFIASPLSHTLIILEKQVWQLFWDAGRLMLMLSVFAVAYAERYAPLVAVSLYSVAMCFAYVVLFLMSLRALKKAVKIREGRNGV